MVEMLHNSVANIFDVLEKLFARMNGKGWGASTVKREITCCSKFINQPELIIDVGGHKGKYSENLRRFFQETHIIIFEPSKLNYAHLLDKFKNDQKIVIYPLALGQNNELSYLYANKEGSELSSLTKRNLEHFGINFEHQELVKVIKFEDYWINNLNKCTIDLFKIDVEGHELDVLTGMGQSIFKTKVIQFEFGGSNIDTRIFFQDLFYFFNSKNFKIFRITPFGAVRIKMYAEIDEFFITTNYIAVNANY